MYFCSVCCSRPRLPACSSIVSSFASSDQMSHRRVSMTAVSWSKTVGELLVRVRSFCMTSSRSASFLCISASALCRFSLSASLRFSYRRRSSRSFTSCACSLAATKARRFSFKPSWSRLNSTWWTRSRSSNLRRLKALVVSGKQTGQSQFR